MFQREQSPQQLEHWANLSCRPKASLNKITAEFILVTMKMLALS